MKAQMTKKMTDIEKSLIFVLGTLEELIAKGLIGRTNEFEYLTEAGMVLYRELLSLNYEPSKELMLAAVTMFKRQEDDDGQEETDGR